MNRLQKKCFIATAGFHLTLLLVLVFGSAFFSPRSKPDDLKLLEVVPLNPTDAPLNSGVKGAQPPPPSPEPPKPVQPKLEPPKPVVKPVEPVTPPEKISPDELTPVKPPPHKIEVDLNKVTRVVPKNSPLTKPDDSEKKAELERARTIKSALRNLKNNLTSATEIDMPGNSSAAYANYASIVKSIYDAGWTPPDNTASDDANVKVSVTISRDGSVVTSRIVEKSGDASVDSSVQRTLDRINFIKEFPDDAKDKERTYIINFNLKSKRMLG